MESFFSLVALLVDELALDRFSFREHGPAETGDERRRDQHGSDLAHVSLLREKGRPAYTPGHGLLSIRSRGNIRLRNHTSGAQRD